MISTATGPDRSQPSFAGGANPAIRFMTARCWLGAVLVAATDEGICAILLGDDEAAVRQDLEARFPQARPAGGAAAFAAMTAKVVDVIETPGRSLDLPLDPRGTSFQQQVWQALRTIPAGTTASYAEIAARIGAPNEAYAVGEACAANMIAVVIPCHRVVRKDGRLAGYRWGFRRKWALLKREGAR